MERTGRNVVLPEGPEHNPLTHYTGVFLRFLQNFFGAQPTGTFHWSPDENLTEISITDQSPWPVEVIEKRPAIVVSRGPTGFGNLSMDQFYSQAGDVRTHTDLVSSSLAINCLSPEGLEAERIAWMVAMSIRRYKRALMKAGLHRVGEEVSVGSESAPGQIVSGDPKEIILVPVQVPFYFQDAWSAEEVDKSLLKGINVALTSERVTQVRAPSMGGKVLQVERTKSLTNSVRITSPTSGPRPIK